MVSGLFIKNIVATTWQADKQEEALYHKSPNCFPQQDSSDVDQSLSPCQNVTARVVAKPQNTVVDHYRSRDYPTTHLRLTLQLPEGQTQTVGDIHSDMWQSIHIGDPVSVIVWRQEVRSIDANGYSVSVFDHTKLNQATASTWHWIIVALLCFFALSLLWGFSRRRAPYSFVK